MVIRAKSRAPGQGEGKKERVKMIEHDEAVDDCACDFCNHVRLFYGRHKYRHTLVDRWSKEPLGQFSIKEAYAMMRTWVVGKTIRQDDGTVLAEWEGRL